MKSSVLLILTIIIYSACTRSQQVPLTPEQALLEAGAWNLQSSDTIHYDFSDNETAHITADQSNCQDQLHYVFAGIGRFSRNTGCTPVANFDAHMTWGMEYNKIFLYANTAPHEGPLFLGVDSIISLTADSLVVSQRVDPRESYVGISSPVPILIHSTFTH